MVSAIPTKRSLPQTAERALAAPTSHEFEQLFRSLAPYVLRVLPRLGVAPRDVEDVAQDVFWCVHRGLPSFEHRSSLKTWVYGICIRRASNYRDRAHRRYEQLRDVVDERIETVTPGRALESRRELERLDAALAELTAAQRAAFVLHEIEGLSVLEVAETLGCSKFTVYARIYAARARVQRSFAQEER